MVPAPPPSHSLTTREEGDEQSDDRDAPSRTTPTEAPAARPASGVVPKSREERLREFYTSCAAEQSWKPDTVAIVHPIEEWPQALPAPPKEPSADDRAAASKLKAKGNDEFKCGNHEAAAEHYTRAIAFAPSSVLHSNRAGAYMMMGWWQQALRDTKAALRSDPKNIKALERKGKCLLFLDRPDDAIQVFSDMEARASEEKGGTQTEVATWTAPRRLWWIVERCMNPVTLDECRKVLAELGPVETLSSPLGSRLRKALAKALVQRSDAVEHQRAIRPALCINRRSAKDGDEVEVITSYAEEALSVTAALLEDHPEDAEIRYWRGRALVRLGRHADAEAQFRRGLREDPEHCDARELLEAMNSLDDCKSRGNAFYREGKLRDAIRMYTMGLEKDPGCIDTITCAQLHYNRSTAHRRQGEFQQALQDANTALALRPGWAKGLYRRGVLLLECGRPAEALTELKVAQRSDPCLDEDLESWIRRAHHWLARPKGEPNHYLRMRLPMDATRDEIKSQYRRLCLLWHPDKNPTEEAAEKFAELRVSYALLLDEERRELFDFGKWKDRPAKHYIKQRTKVKDTYDDTMSFKDTHPWTERTKEGREWQAQRDKEDAAREAAEDPEWLKEAAGTARRRRYSERIKG